MKSFFKFQILCNIKIYEYLAKNRSLSKNIFHGELLKAKIKILN